MTRAEGAGAAPGNTTAKLCPWVLSQPWLVTGEPSGLNQARPVSGTGSSAAGGPGSGNRAARSAGTPARTAMRLRTAVARLSADGSPVQSTQLIALSWQ